MIAGVRANWRRILGILGVLLVGLSLAPNAKPQAPKPEARSEERRVGKECRSRWSPYH